MKFMVANIDLFKETNIVSKDLTIFCVDGAFKLNCKEQEELNIIWKECSLEYLDFFIKKVWNKKEKYLVIKGIELLYPSKQIELARFVAMWINSGIKIIVRTHSDYFLRELSSCICLKNVSKKKLKNLKECGYNEEMALDASRIKAYEIMKGTKILNSLEITQENGIYCKDINNIIREQNINQDKIYQEILKSNSKKEKKGDKK